MGHKYILNDEQNKLRQFNVRIKEEVFLAYEAVRDEMYSKGKTLTVAQAVEDLVKNATRVGNAWLQDNPDAKDVKKRKVKKDKDVAERKSLFLMNDSKNENIK